MLEGKYPVVTGLEHDEMGHPTASPRLHAGMTANRRKKYQQLADELPLPQVQGDPTGEVLLVGWGSTYARSTRQSTGLARAAKASPQCIFVICIRCRADWNRYSTGFGGSW